MTWLVYRNAPQNIFHSWVELFWDGQWYELEAFILDKRYLHSLQAKYRTCAGLSAATASRSRTFKIR